MENNKKYIFKFVAYPGYFSCDTPTVYTEIYLDKGNNEYYFEKHDEYVKDFINPLKPSPLPFRKSLTKEQINIIKSIIDSHPLINEMPRNIDCGILDANEDEFIFNGKHVHKKTGGPCLVISGRESLNEALPVDSEVSTEDQMYMVSQRQYTIFSIELYKLVYELTSYLNYIGIRIINDSNRPYEEDYVEDDDADEYYRPRYRRDLGIDKIKVREEFVEAGDMSSFGTEYIIDEYGNLTVTKYRKSNFQDKERDRIIENKKEYIIDKILMEEFIDKVLNLIGNSREMPSIEGGPGVSFEITLGCGSFKINSSGTLGDGVNNLWGLFIELLDNEIGIERK